MTHLNASGRRERFLSIAALAMLFLLLPSILPAQSTISTGNINGLVSDPSGAAVPGAKVTIIRKDTGVSTDVTTNSSGFYNSGSITPGNYTVRVAVKGFATSESQVMVQIGNNSAVNFKLQVGAESTTVNVEAAAVGVNTEQTSVQGVLTATQIENLPVNGRNFLDLAQLEPGVQIQDGTNFDPTKIGYQSISMGGRFGRTARIQVDGTDISDETVGTTTGNIASSAIQEFQIAQSTMDLSNDLSSSGVVNVSTKSGTNTIHGEGYEYYRSSNVDASLPKPVGFPDPNYHRNQYGGSVGGAFIKDKLFFFAEGDGTNQNLFVPVEYAAPFNGFSGGFNSPFGNPNALGRLDFVAPHNIKLFFRYDYSQIKAEGTFFSDSLQVYQSKNYTRNYVGGADFTTGSWTHSFRFSYLKFQNEIADGVIGSGLPLANFPGNGQYVNIEVSGGPSTGPNLLAPQSTPQSDKQVKYDGAKTLGRHILRYGVDFNHIQGGGYAKFFSLAPQIVTNINPGDAAFAASGPYPGGAGNPLNYPVDLAVIGNGQGFSTTQPAFGFPAGGLGPDNRLGLYIADTWKMFSNFTVNLGLRYVRDTGRTDSDLPGLPFLNNLLPNYSNLGAPIPNQNKNFGPSLGIAWDPWKTGNNVIRAGIGLYYENVIFNNVLFDRPLRLPTGAFLQSPTVCSNGTINPIPGVPLSATPAECGTPGAPITVGAAGSALATLQQQYQALSPFNLTNPNPNYLQNFLGSATAGGANFPNGLFAPNYKTPRSTQINVGIQHQFAPGVVGSVDYVRNVTTGLLLDVDQNHTGDTRFFSPQRAHLAIANTTASFGCAGGFSSAAINCAIANGATMSSFASNGLDSQGDLGGTAPCLAIGGCAFGGLNPLQPAMPFLTPSGISKYNALQMKLTYQKSNPFKGLRSFNAQISYAYSSFDNSGGGPGVSGIPGGIANSDQDFIVPALDNADPNRYFGPSLLDRPQQFSFGIVGSLPWNFQVSFIGHFDSSLPLPIIVTGSGAGAIFRTDFTGDGSTQDPLPGTVNGAFGRDVQANGLNALLGRYNAAYGNQPTPAGMMLVNNGLFSVSQLQQLGGVAPCVQGFGLASPNCTLQQAPQGQENLGSLRTFDLKLNWTYKVELKSHIIQLQPGVGFYNLFNLSNFDLPPNTLTGALTGGPGTINGTTAAGRITNRVGAGTGVFNLGAPRAMEFGMRIAF
ncbi:MAG: carboxypeptidase regulatory-like domain-containing protein [Candidatus Korobacteraceae bacterium]